MSVEQSQARDSFIAQATCMTGTVAVEANSDRHFPRHMHDQFGVGLLLAGAQQSLSGRGEIEAVAGDLITVNPGEIHDGRPLGCSARRWRMLYFDTEIVARIAGGLELPSGSELHHPVLGRPGLAARAFDDLHRALLPFPAQVDMALVEEAMLTLFAPLFDVATAPPATAPAAIGQAKMAIDEDPAQLRTLEEMSHQAGLGRYQFLRAFKSVTGLPPHTYRIQKQLQMARRMIIDGTPLAGSAIACGFSDQAHFTRHFTRTYGLRPGRLAVASGRTSGR